MFQKTLCVVPQWEAQHQNVTCEQFQRWKRDNDPEYQKQGLAGYLRDNGISEIYTVHVHMYTAVFPSLTVHTVFVWQRVRTAGSSTLSPKAAVCTSPARSVGTSSAAAATTLSTRSAPVCSLFFLLIAEMHASDGVTPLNRFHERLQTL